MKLPRTIAAAMLGGMMLSTSAHAVTEIQWWHAMGGELGEKLVSIADGFNATQSDYKIVPIYKGNYTETMTAAVAAFRAHQNPAIVQVFEVGTATMMAAKGAVYPVYKLMADTKQPFDPKAYLAAVTGYYTDSHNNMLSLPFNSSTPVMYYNKDAFKKAGLNPDMPPRTWPEMETAAKALQKAGVSCGFTTGWQSWVQIENFSAWHNLPIGTKENGIAGMDTRLTIDDAAHVKHIAQLAQWQKSKIFDYGGRRSDSAPKFYKGDCAMYMNSSASYAGVKKNVNFAFGVAPLPYWPELAKTPQNTIIGGASLWVLNGRPKAEYAGVAKFFSYLSSPAVQADWHQFTGYLPITKAAYALTRKQGFYDKNPGTDVAIKEITNKAPTANSKGLRFGNFVQIRDIINDELESVWAGKVDAKTALKAIVERGNKLLRAFEKANKG